MAGSIVANKFGDKAYTDVPQSDRNQYEEKDYQTAKTKHGKTVNGKTIYMTEDEWNKGRDDLKQKKDSGDNPISAEIERKQAAKIQPQQKAFKDKSWNEIKTEYNGKGDLIAKAFAEHPEYEAGPKTKEGMKELGYSKDDKGAWVKDDPQAQKVMSSVTDENGNVNPQKAQGAAAQYEQKLIDMGAGEYDMDGNFHLKPTNNKKGWETWATMLSVALSAIGIAAGVPIIPINFKAITGKDTRDAQIQALQQQYMNLQAGDAGKVGSMQSDIETGNMALKNQDALAAQEKHAAATSAQKDVIKAQSEANKELARTQGGEQRSNIRTQSQADIDREENAFKNRMKELQSDKNFTLNMAALNQTYAKEMRQLESALSTGSAIDIMKFQTSGFLKELKDMGMSPSDIATYMAAKQGISPSDKNWDRVGKVTNALSDVAGAAGDIINPLK